MPAASLTVPADSGLPTVTIGTYASPSAICSDGNISCIAETGTARVTLTAQAETPPNPYWPDVQVAFVIETTPYDGVYDHWHNDPGGDRCAAVTHGASPLCEESNGVPFFIENAGNVARAIDAANPRSNVSFAMVDFFGTDYDWNDGPQDSWKYHVDAADFLPANDFGRAVITNFQRVQMNQGNGWGCACGMDDNLLHSSSITALYGAIIGSGLTWKPSTHHVLVLMGSTAPRDPSYPVNYWVSAFDSNYARDYGFPEYGGTCEPSYGFDNGLSPPCEGWVRSQDGIPTHSIAALTRTSPTCTESVGRTCTVDVIDYWDTATDPYSFGWPEHGMASHYSELPGGTAGPGGLYVLTDSANILNAGCDLAAATHGSWDGPAFWTCPNGVSGSLQYVEHGPIDAPITSNPTLFASLQRISFGPIVTTVVANGTSQPMFTYVPPANFKLAPDPEFAAACSTPHGFLPSCQLVPSSLRANGVEYLGWNWSTIPSQNLLYQGDFWTVSFNIVNTGTPYGRDPVLACTTVPCSLGGAGANAGLFSTNRYYWANSTYLVSQSFPLASVTVIGPLIIDELPTVPAPAPSNPTGLPVSPAPPPSIVVPPALVPASAAPSISPPATVAAFLGAGFMRVALRNRPIALRIAAKSGVFPSRPVGKVRNRGAKGRQ
jgi:hypothetical protein